MDSAEIRTALRRFLGEIIRARKLADDTNIFASGYVNSLFAIQLILYVEKTFDIVVEGVDLDIANFLSVDALCSFVEKKRLAQVVPA